MGGSKDKGKIKKIRVTVRKAAIRLLSSKPPSTVLLAFSVLPL